MSGRRTKSSIRAWLTAVVVAAGLMSTAAVGRPGDVDQRRIDELRAHIRQRLQQTGAPSVSVAVARNGRIVWEEGFGWADRERRVAATAHSRYSVASVSKPLTTTALMLLAERGKIDLDHPVNDYLGPAKLIARVGDERAATVRLVAQHRAGLSEFYQAVVAGSGKPRPTMDDNILRYGNLIAAPGERYRYSNLGYGVLSEVIERASGRSFEDFMRSEVFLPLGMLQSTIDIPEWAKDQQAIRYDARTGEPLPAYRDTTPGAGDVYTSAHDLALFGMFHLKNHLQTQARLLSDAAIDELHDSELGWTVSPGTGPQRQINKYGGMPGVAAALRLVPSADLAVVVLSNGSWYAPPGRDIKPQDITEKILQAFLPEYRPATSAVADPAVATKDSCTLLQRLTGEWRGHVVTERANVPVSLQVRGCDEVRLKIDDQPWTLLDDVRASDGWFGGRALAAGALGTTCVERAERCELRFELRERGDALAGGVGVSSSFLDLPWGHTVTLWAQLHKQRGESARVVIDNVHVVDVVAGKASELRAVEIDGDRIVAIRKAGEARIESGGRVFDAAGGYLVPGFWDMHAHLNYPSVAEQWAVPLFVAAGVTGVRDMQGDCWPEGCKSNIRFMRGLQDRIARGELLGPRILAIGSEVVSGPRERGDDPAWLAPGTEQEGRAVAREIKRRGADFIKPYDTLPRAAYFGLMSEARELGMSVSGHVPLSVTSLEAIGAGQRTIEHAKHPAFDCSKYSRTMNATFAAWTAGESASVYSGWAKAARGDKDIGSLYPLLLDSYDEALCTSVIDGIAAAKAWYVPTLITRKFEAYADDAKFLSDDRLRLVPHEMRSGWARDATNYQRRFQRPGEKQSYVDFYELDVRLTGKMHAAGVQVLVGTDASDSYCFPGSAMHDEMQELQRAGLSNADILRAATISAARFMGMDDRFGTVAEGMAADLVVLKSDPLQDIGNVRNIEAVVRAGQLLDKEALRALVDQVAVFAEQSRSTASSP